MRYQRIDAIEEKLIIACEREDIDQVNITFGGYSTERNNDRIYVK